MEIKGRIFAARVDNGKGRTWVQPQVMVARQVLKRFLHKSQCSHRPFHVPFVVEQTAGGEKLYDIYSRLLKERIVMVMGFISDDIASLIMAQMLFLQSESATKPINMYINSPGGVVSSGLAIYDTMQYVQPPVATWCVGQAASMGSFLLAAGTPGMRYSLPNSRIMVHQILGSAQGQATDVQIQAEEMLRMKRNLNHILAKHTKNPVEVIERTLERDRFMTPEEAKKFGMIDEVLDKPPVVEERKK